LVIHFVHSWFNNVCHHRDYDVPSHGGQDIVRASQLACVVKLGHDLLLDIPNGHALHDNPRNYLHDSLHCLSVAYPNRRHQLLAGWLAKSVCRPLRST